MSKKKVSLVCILMASLILQAHEFWLQPNKFQYAIGESVTIDFMVGESFVGEKWDLSRHRIVKLDHFTKDGTKSLGNEVKPGSNLNVRLEKAGTHLFVMQSNNAFSELDAEKFNEYLKEDGLEEVISHRKRTNALNKPGKEFYARCAKVLVRAGDRSDETFKKRAGLARVASHLTTHRDRNIIFFARF